MSACTTFMWVAFTWKGTWEMQGRGTEEEKNGRTEERKNGRTVEPKNRRTVEPKNQILYNSLISSHLNSNITAWGFVSHKLSRLQKRALRLITDSKYNAHTQPLLKVLGTLTLDDTYKMQCLKFYYKFIQGNLPPFFDTFFIEKITLHNYQTRRRNDFHVQTTHSSTAQNCIRYYILKLLSTLPTRVTDKSHTHSYTGFCGYVKKYFVDQYIDSCSIKNCYICSN